MSDSSKIKDFFNISEPIDFIYQSNRACLEQLLMVPMEKDMSYSIGMYDAEFYKYEGSKPETFVVLIEYTTDDFGNKQVTRKEIVKEFTTPLDTLEQRCAALVPDFCATLEEARALADLNLVGKV